MIKKYFIYAFLAGILVVGLFSRTYKATDFYQFDHDQDLYSWIVKDIVVDKNFRLIGQLTSIEGLFIGPLFYYLLAVFYLPSGMDPLSAVIPATIISLSTILSIYFVFSKLFSKTSGIVGALIYTFSIGAIFFDRWIVPTQPTVIWSVWFLYAAVSIGRGDKKALPLIGILAGLVWHIHVALAPLFFIILLIFLLQRKIFDRKRVLLTFGAFLVLSSPFWLFEIRHGFAQTKAVLDATSVGEDYIKGLPKMLKVLDAFSKSITVLLVDRLPIPLFVLPVASFGCLVFLRLKNILSVKEVSMLLMWVAAVIFFQFLSKKPVSEYYFTSLVIPVLLALSLFAAYLYKNHLGKIIVVFGLLGYLSVNMYMFFNIPGSVKGYFHKKSLVDYIQEDVTKNNYPCIGINYIATYGNAVGFRYLFWLDGINIVKPGYDIPVYDIVIPPAQVNGDVDARFGHFSVITPKGSNKIDESYCVNPQNQLVPMLGFTN